MKALIFDADKSLSSIGGADNVRKIFGFQPIPINGGLAQVTNTLGKLFSRKEVPTKHELTDEPLTVVSYELNDLAKKNDLQAIVIDTLSHIFRQDMRLCEASNKTGQMEMKDWGKLERMYNDFLSKMSALPIPVIVNSHIKLEKGEGIGVYVPQFKGSTVDFISEYFDVVLYTKVARDKKIYTWQTSADPQRFAKDRLGVLDSAVEQNFKTILTKYAAGGINNPKILVVGESGTGKTKALPSMN